MQSCFDIITIGDIACWTGTPNAAIDGAWWDDAELLSHGRKLPIDTEMPSRRPLGLWPAVQVMA